MRRPMSDRWSPEALAKVQVVPGAGRQRAQEERAVGFEEGTPEAPNGARPPAVREMRINISDLEKYKHYDPNCKQCHQIGPRCV